MKIVKASIQIPPLFIAGLVVLLLILSAAPGAAQTPYCTDHDPTQWHPAVDPVSGCYYGHEHGDNPLPPGSPFGPVVFGGDEAVSDENVYSHAGYQVFYGHRSSPDRYTPTADACDDFRMVVHFDPTPRGRAIPYHSYELSVAHCSGGQTDVSTVQGWLDFGTTLVPRDSGDPGTRPIRFVPTPEIFAAAQPRLNIWEEWLTSSPLGFSMSVLAGEVPTLAFDGADPANLSTWTWTGGASLKRRLSTLVWNLVGTQGIPRGEFWTDVYGNLADPASPYCQSQTCLRQYISPLADTEPDGIINGIFGLDVSYDVTGVNYPESFPLTNGQMAQGGGGSTPTPDGPALVVQANPQNPAPGEAVSLSLDVYNMTDLYGLQVQCQVNPAVMTGTSVSGADGFNDSNSYIVDQGFNADGTWLAAASRLQPNPSISGNATALVLNYTYVSAGDSQLTCEALAVDSLGNTLDMQVIISGPSTVALPVQPLPGNWPPPAPPVDPGTPEPTPEPTPLPQAGTIGGTVQYQNRADNAGIVAQLYGADGALLAEMTTEADGVYNFADVPLGDYTLVLSAGQHIPVMHDVSLTDAAPALDLPLDTLASGDTDNSGEVDIVDATFIGANLGVAVPPAPLTADLNNDGTINISDLVLVGSNFGAVSPLK